MRVSVPSTRWKRIADGAKRICRAGWDITVFEYRQAEEVRDAFARHGVRYLFLGKSGAILLGYPDTTQDADVYVEKTPGNGELLVSALVELRFDLTDEEKAQVRRGKDFIQLKNGPFDLDLVFAPDGIERFDDAWKRRVEVAGFQVCSIDDIIRSKRAANREKDRESLPRLESFRDYLNARS
jgi:hypothetical protein